MKKYESREEILEELRALKDLISVVGKTPKLVAKAKRLIERYKNWSFLEEMSL
jgi:predicted nucleic acid-binding protein